jgi:thiamine pyrophosphokinase
MCDLVKMSRYKPDVIKGDLDSIRSEVKDFYAMLVSNKDSIHKYKKL